VENVTASGNGGWGILLDGSTGEVVDATASGNLVGIHLGGGRLLRCIARENSSSGVQLDGGGGLVRQLDSYDNGGSGLSQLFGSGWTIAESAVRSNGGHGISVCAANNIRNNFSFGNVGAGIHLRCGNNLVFQNTLKGNGTAIEALTGSDQLVDNFE
jgi:hypothetical protein